MRKVRKCECCGEPHRNPKFCSQSCSAKVNNKVPKRKRALFSCQNCGAPATYRRKYCKDPRCHPGYVDWLKVTMGELRSKARWQIDAQARQLARVAYRKYGRPCYCLLCGYNKHFDVCHVKAISDFPDEALVSETIAPSNLIALCRNHHWEFDHGLLSENERTKIMEILSLWKNIQIK